MLGGENTRQKLIISGPKRTHLRNFSARYYEENLFICFLNEESLKSLSQAPLKQWFPILCFLLKSIFRAGVWILEKKKQKFKNLRLLNFFQTRTNSYSVINYAHVQYSRVFFVFLGDILFLWHSIPTHSWYIFRRYTCSLESVFPLFLVLW